MAALSHNRSKEEYPCISVRLSVCICGKKARKAGKVDEREERDKRQRQRQKQRQKVF